MVKKIITQEVITSIRSSQYWQAEVKRAAKEADMSVSEFIRAAVAMGAKKVVESKGKSPPVDNRIAEVANELIKLAERLAGI